MRRQAKEIATSLAVPEKCAAEHALAPRLPTGPLTR